MKREFIKLTLKLTSLLLSTVPVIVATLSYFPLWRREGGAAMLSGFTLLLVLVGIAPLIKLLKRFLKSPSVTGVWLILFLVFFALRHVADEMLVISLIGYLTNLCAAVLWRLSGRIKK